MSDVKEVKRWNVPRPVFIERQNLEAHDGHVMVVLASDHDRIVTALHDQCGDLMVENSRQARVIEKLKAMLNRFAPFDDLKTVNQELGAIESEGEWT